MIAPATANTLAKLAHGLADDLLSATALEFRGPIVVAPAMHAGMWTSPVTQANVAALAARGVRFVGPVEGALAHGDEGIGRLAEPEDIVETVRAAAEELPGVEGPLAGRRVLVTAGPTYEPIDPVRFVGNRSSGKMGIAIASEALARGATVTLVLGPGTVAPPAGVDVIRVDTAEAMRGAVLARADADAIVMAAAVADFRPKVAADRKLKKEHGVPELVFEPTPDILRELAAAPATGTGAGRVRGRDRRRRRRPGATSSPARASICWSPTPWDGPRPGSAPTRTTPRSWPPRGRTRRCAPGRRPSLPPPCGTGWRSCGNAS